MKQTPSSLNRYWILAIMCLGTEIMYFVPYLRWTFYDPLQQALGLNHSQCGALMSTMGIVMTLSYFPGGWLADRISARKMLSFSYLATGLSGLYYATYPSYAACMGIAVFWGISTTLTLWAALIKATQGLASEEEQGRFFGLLEGGRALATTLLGIVVIWLFAKAGEGKAGLTLVINIFSILGILLGIVTWFALPETENSERTGAGWADIVTVFKMPVVWLIGVIVLCNYTCFVALTYLTPYLTDIIKVSVSVSAFLALLRTWGIGIFGGPVGGFVADKVGSSTRIILYCFAAMFAGTMVFVVLPGEPGMMAVVVITMFVISAATFAMRGIYYATMDEVCIPRKLTGAAAGLISMVGFLPEVYMYPLAGHWMDTHPGAYGYKLVFTFTAAMLFVGFLASLVLYRIIKNKKEARAETLAPTA
ncbi:MAG: MFS transporter [Desulfobacterales bacterium]|nr:MFS transporter [Desulfobacterales bacterium]